MTVSGCRSIMLSIILAVFLGNLPIAAESLFWIDEYIVDDLSEEEYQTFYQGKFPGLFDHLRIQSKIGFDKLDVGFKSTIGEVSTADTAEILLQIRRLIENERYNRAIVHIKDGLALQPDNPELLRLAAITFSILGQYREADTFYYRYLQIIPFDASMMAGWASVNIRMKEFTRARHIANRAISIKNDSIPARVASLYLDVYNREQPAWLDYWIFINIRQLILSIDILINDYDEMAELLGAGTMNSVCKIIAGVQTKSQLTQLNNMLRQVLQTKSDQAPTQLEKQLFELKEQFQLNRPILEINLARAFYNSSNVEKAFQIMQQLLQKFPNYYLAHYWMGSFFLSENDVLKAEKSLLTAIALNEEAHSAKLLLAEVYSDLDKVDKIWPLLQEVAYKNKDIVIRWLEFMPEKLSHLKKETEYSSLCRKLGIPPESE